MFVELLYFQDRSAIIAALPRLLRYATKAREGTLKLHFYLESISELPAYCQ